MKCLNRSDCSDPLSLRRFICFIRGHSSSDIVLCHMFYIAATERTVARTWSLSHQMRMKSASGVRKNKWILNLQHSEQEDELQQKENMINSDPDAFSQKRCHHSCKLDEYLMTCLWFRLEISFIVPQFRIKTGLNSWFIFSPKQEAFFPEVR